MKTQATCALQFLPIRVAAESLAPAIGWSARDTFYYLKNFNHVYDKSPDRWNVLTRAEANWGILKILAKQRVGQAAPAEISIALYLQNTFFPGRIWEYGQGVAPKCTPARFERGVDGDTVALLRFESPPPCNPIPEKLRLTAADSLECFMSSKAYRERDKVVEKILSQYAVPPEMVDLVKEIILARMSHLGRLAKYATTDFSAWAQSQNVGMQVCDSYIFSPVPELQPYWGMLQMYDSYDRAVGGYRADTGSSALVAEYIRTRLPALMLETGEADFNAFLAEYSNLYEQLKNMATTPQGMMIAPLLSVLDPMFLKRPRDMFNPDQTGLMAAQWSSTGDNDWGRALFHVGLAFYYPKYASEAGPLYEATHVNSRTNQFGIWKDMIAQLASPEVAGSMEDQFEQDEAVRLDLDPNIEYSINETVYNLLRLDEMPGNFEGLPQYGY